MTASELRARKRSHLELTEDEFERRLAAYGHQIDEIDRLWGELAPADEGPARRGAGLGLGAVIAVYLGLLLVVAASVSLVGVYWDALGTGGVLALAVAYLSGYLVASDSLRRRGLAQPADVLEAVAVGWVALATYAVQELAGLWPEAASDSGEIHMGLTTIALVGLAAAVVLLALRPDALLLVPIAAATALLAVDLSELVFAATIDDLDARRITAFVLPLGVVWIAAGLWLDATRRRPFATWAHWCGLLLMGAAVVAMIPKTVPGFALLGLLGALALFFSAFVRHWSFTVVGALGVLLATQASISEFGRLAPIVIAVAGIAMIFAGLRWSRWRESIRSDALARLPAGTRAFVERLAP
jgi:hypothetical protein